MWGSDWELCARFAPPNVLDLYLVKRKSIPAKAWIYRIVPGQLPTFWSSSLIVPGMGNFPWGEDVDPD